MKKIITLLTIGAVSAFALMTPSELMTKVYGKYDPEEKCWHNGDYCMEIDNAKVINSDTGKRLYLIATRYDAPIGAFVVEEQNGKDVIIAQNKNIEEIWLDMGEHYGWKLVKLGSNDYWGWINQGGGQHDGGYENSWYYILAPYGKTIKSLGRILSSASDTMTFEDGQDATIELEGELKIDDSNKNVKIYPLLITVSGINNSKKIKPIQYKINFDLKKWQYIIPSNYIIKMLY